MVRIPEKKPIVKQFEVNGQPAVLTMTFSYTAEGGNTLRCNVEDTCLRVFNGDKWIEVKTGREKLEENLLQNINDGILTTESIVNELAKREGVQEIVIEPHRKFIIQTKKSGDDDAEFEYPSKVKMGPARILVVID